MSNIDEVSRILGSIQSDITHIKKGTNDIRKKVDKTHDGLHEVKSHTVSAHERLDDIAPHVEDYKNMKQRGIGLTAVLAVIFGVVGSAVSKFIHVLLNGVM